MLTQRVKGSQFTADLSITGALFAAGHLADARQVTLAPGQLVMPQAASPQAAAGPVFKPVHASSASSLPLPVTTTSRASDAVVLPASQLQPDALVSSRRLSEAAAPHARCEAGAPVATYGSCACAAGWAGKNCMACTQPSVCPVFTGQAESTCDSHMVYGNLTSYKAYDCSLVGGLSRWVTGVAALCNVRGEKLPFKDSILGLQVGGGWWGGVWHLNESSLLPLSALGRASVVLLAPDLLFCFKPGV